MADVENVRQLREARPFFRVCFASLGFAFAYSLTPPLPLPLPTTPPPPGNISSRRN